MITVKTPEEIKILREGGKILAQTLAETVDIAKEGISSLELDCFAEKIIKNFGAVPSFKNYKGKGDKIAYPKSICVSINDEIVHGVPSKNKILKDGDVVSIDIGVKYKGLYTDSAITISIGKINELTQKLIDTTKESLNKGIKTIKEGICIGDIGFAIQKHIEGGGFNVIKDLVGHGVGYRVHEEPMIPNYGKKGDGLKIKAGMVLALEPMANNGKDGIYLANDKWGLKTKDGSLSAHFEHTIVVTKNGAEILTEL